MNPKVSICVPNLNTRSFLEERFETIFEQTFQDWELIVLDGFSNDGSWEYIQEQAAREPRMRIFQEPPEGIYPAWNQCIERTRGEYVYIATSDDTMSLDCLEKLVAALEAHPDCDLAHCPLRVIDESGRETDRTWHTESAFVQSAPALAARPHIRRAPFDGLLHLCRHSVYISITQLLIRRRLFDKVGRFETRWGSISDFNWNMRASLVGNTVHVPDAWGGWRRHGRQITAGIDESTEEHQRIKQEMIDHALASRAVPISRAALADWSREIADFHNRSRALLAGLAPERPRIARAAWLTGLCLSGSAVAWDYLRWRFSGTSRGRTYSTAAYVSRFLQRRGLKDALTVITGQHSQ